MRGCLSLRWLRLLVGLRLIVCVRSLLRRVRKHRSRLLLCRLSRRGMLLMLLVVRVLVLRRLVTLRCRLRSRRRLVPLRVGGRVKHCRRVCVSR